MTSKLVKLANELEKTYLFRDQTAEKLGKELAMRAGTIRRLRLDETDFKRRKQLSEAADLLEIAAKKLLTL